MYRAGVSLEEFGKLNMRQIHYISNAYAEKQKEDFKISDIQAFIQGRYMVDALLCTVGRMLGGKKVDYSYPEQAYSMAQQEEQLSEDELQRQREAFMAALKTMEINFKREKQKQRKENENGVS